MTAGQLILFVFGAVVLRSLLQTGVLVLYAARRFFHVGVLYFLQAFLANCAAIWAAWRFGRLDVILAWFWSAQLIVAALGLTLAAWQYPIRFDPRAWRLGTMRRLFVHGARIQLVAISELVNFQFDKFVIASLVGLWAVGPYEVANRSALALRSIPMTGLDSYLPRAAIGAAGGNGSWAGYIATTRLACLCALVFLIAPLAMAPVWLYAWTGQMGHFGRWAFAMLAVGATCSVVASPAAALAQASGQPQILARAALVSVGLNIPLSLMMAHLWGLKGAAAGTAVAMSASAFLVILGVHRLYHRRLRDTLAEYRSLWPLLAICVALGAVVNIRFDWWIATLDPVTRYAHGSRVLPGMVAVAGYLVCMGLMLLAGLAREVLTPEELLSIVRFGRGARRKRANEAEI
jgi:O-antigen/teichoic acid export membrane protein